MKLVLLGPPGAGKGTQAQMLMTRFAIPQISTGDMLRAAIRDQSPMGLKAKQHMDSGGLVPDEVVIGIVRERLQQSDCASGFILDGFPRTVPQADALKQVLAEIGRRLDAVVSLQVNSDALVERLTGRRTCGQCGKGFHLLYEPPATDGSCTECGGQLVQRDDDQEATIRNRLEVYQQQTAPLEDYYRNENLLVAVDGMKPIDQVQEDIIRIISDL